MSPGRTDDTLCASAAQPTLAATPTVDDEVTVPPTDAPAPTVTPSQATSRLPQIDRHTYVIAGQFAQGGIGRILRAHDPSLDRQVALKELLVRGRPVDEERFVREVLLTARLQHPGVVPIYAAGRWPTGEPFFAMKLVSGRSFDRVIAEATSLAARLALLPHVLAIAETVAYAHSQRIIHRDLKPHNVLVGGFGETVVIDWGLAKELDVAESPASAEPGSAAASKDLTFVGAVVGTPGYMSPEQAEGGEVDTGTDVYALGAILYQVLSGQLPYDAGNAMEMIYKTAFEPPVPLRSREPDAPDELVAIVDKAMARDRGRRYPSAREFADDLRRFQTGQIVGAHRYSAWERVLRFVRRHRALLGLAAVSVALIVAVTALSFVQVREQRDLAEDARDLAEDAEQRAQTAQVEAERRADNLSFEQARLVQDSDPIEALRLLHGLSPAADWRRTRQLAADLDARGLPRVLRGHRAAISRVVFSPASDLLATTSDDCTLRVWDMSSWTSRVFRGHTGDVWRAAFSPDGRKVATTSRDHSVRVWDLDGREAQVLLGHTDGVRNVIFSPDGRSLYSSDDALALRRWDLDTGVGEVIDRCFANSVPWTARHIGCIDIESNRAYVHDIATGGRTVVHPGELVLQQAGGVSPDGRWFAGTVAGSVWLHDNHAGVGRLLAWPQAQGQLWFGSLREIRFSSASDQLVAPASADYLRHYDLVADRGHLLAPHDGYTRRAGFSPDGSKIASVGGDSRVAIWDVPTATAYSLAVPAHMIDAQFSPDGRWVAAVGNDPRVFVWPASSFAREQYVPPEPIRRGAAALAPAVSRAILGGATAIHLVDTVDMRTLATIPTARPIQRAAVSGAGSHALAIDDEGELLGLSLPGGDVVLRTPLGPGCDSFNVTADPERPRFFVGCQDTRVLLVDLAAPEPVRELEHIEGGPPAAFFPGEPSFVFGGGHGRLLRHDDGAALRELLRVRYRISVTQPIPGTRELVFAAEDHVEHVDIEGRSLGELRGHRLQVGEIRVSGDGRWILTVSRDNILRVFDRASHELRIELAPPDLVERIAAISHDGSRIAVAVINGDVLLWDIGDEPDPLAPRRDFRRLRGLEEVQGAAIEADGRSVIAVGVDGRVIRWRDTLPTDAAGLREFIAARADADDPPRPEVGCASE